MNRQKNIAVFAVIATIAMTTISLSGDSTTALMVSSPLQSEGVEMLGHIQYTLTDSNDQIVKYVQGDNTVVNHGKDCVAENTFGVDSAECVGAISGTPFDYIAIGNGTRGLSIPAFSDLTQLSNSTTDGCTATGESGEINRIQVVPTREFAATNSSGTVGTGTVIELNTATAFDFTSQNATTIYQSGIFNSAETSQALGQCDEAPKGGVLTNMFAIQELNSANGIVVTDGDSLSVKWTITVG